VAAQRCGEFSGALAGEEQPPPVDLDDLGGAGDEPAAALSAGESAIAELLDRLLGAAR
jgi:hypothetical protein